MTHTPPSAVGRTLSAHRSRWQVRSTCGRFDPGLQRDQLVAQVGQPAGKRRARLQELLDQLVPTIGTDRFVVPRVQRAEVRDRSPGGWRPRPHPPAPGRDSGREPQVDPLVHPDLAALHGGEDTTRPSVRRTCGVGTPAAYAASWNAVATRTSSSLDWWNGTFTAQLPSAVSSRQTTPCLPRATGPSDSRAAPPSAKRRARSAASTGPLQHKGARRDQPPGVRTAERKEPGRR